MNTDFDDDDDFTMDCPQCGREIYDDAPQCPYCGHYITASGSNTQFPAWIKWVVVLTVLGMSLPFLLVLLRMLTEN